MKRRILSLALTLSLILALIPTAFAASTTSESAPNLDTAAAWAYEGINEAVAKGFIPTDLQNNYTNIITRQEFCRIAVQFVAYKTGKSIDAVLTDKGVSRDVNAFTDTQDPDILAAFALGITSGTGNNQFTPNGEFSREQAATMILNVCRVLGIDTENPPTSDFTDLNTASSWAVDGINFVRARGIMIGTSTDTTKPMFSPKGTFTRQESIVTFATCSAIQTHDAIAVLEKWSNDGYGVLQGNVNALLTQTRGMMLGELAVTLSNVFGYTERVAANVTPSRFDEAVEKAIGAGVMDKETTINAGLRVTCEQVIRYMAIAYGIAPLDGDTTFEDDAAIDPTYKPYVKAFQQLGYIDEKANNLFDPQGFYTLSEAIHLLDNMTSEITDQSVSGQTYAKTLIVRESGVTITDTTVNGDLIIGQGVGDGEVTLDNVKVTGRLIVYGGGSHSIIIKGGSQISYVVANKQGGEPANFRIEGDSTVTALEVNPGSSARVTGHVAEINVSANAIIEIAEGSMIQNITVDGEKVTIYVSDGSTVKRITIENDNVVIEGQGKVEAVVVGTGVSGAVVDTNGTVITNNGIDAVKTNNGKIAPGESATTNNSKPPESNNNENDNTGNDNTGNNNTGNYKPTPTNPVSFTVNTLDELRAALQKTAVATIHVPVMLVNLDADITIPSGKTVLLKNNAGLQLKSLVVNGTLRGDENAVLFIRDQLSGTGLNMDKQNGFFGLGAAYTPHTWVWYATDFEVQTTGWWPIFVEADNQSALTEALTYDTVHEVLLTGNFSISTDLSIRYLTIEGNIVIPTGVTVEAFGVTLSAGNLTVNGTLRGASEDAAIWMYGVCDLNLNHTTYAGPNPNFIDYYFARVIPWSESGWGTPYLYNWNTGSDIVFAENVAIFDDITYLVNTYPELTGMNLYGDRFSFTESNTLPVAGNWYSIHGNQTFGFGEDVDTIPAVQVAAGVTLTIPNGVTVELISDSPDLQAMVGADSTSRIIVGDNAAVFSNTGDGLWQPGTYTWDAGANQWELTNPGGDDKVYPVAGTVLNMSQITSVNTATNQITATIDGVNQTVNVAVNVAGLIAANTNTSHASITFGANGTAGLLSVSSDMNLFGNWREIPIYVTAGQLSLQQPTAVIGTVELSKDASIYCPGQIQGNVAVTASGGAVTIISIASNDMWAEVAIFAGDAVVDFTTVENNQASYRLDITNEGSGTVTLTGEVASLGANQWTNPDGTTLRKLTITSMGGNLEIGEFIGSGSVEIEIVGVFTANARSSFCDSNNQSIAAGGTIPAGTYEWDTIGWYPAN